MATLIPSSLQDTGRPLAEQRVLDRLSELDDAWRIYHGLRYVQRPTGGRPAREGEIDFLLFHPDHGMMVLEVKGGGIDYDGRTGQFTSEDRHQQKNVVKNPFEQARASVHYLKAQMTANPDWLETGIDFVHGHGVVFPDCLWTPPVAAADMPAEIVIDRARMTEGNLEDRLLSLFEFWGRDRKTLNPIGRKRLKRLGQNFLAPHFALMPSLGDVMAWNERALLRLSDEQELALDFLERNPRAIVEGCSGSGKTLIALERVRRLVAEGKSVLFLCFNRILGQTLREAVKGMKGLPGDVTATTFHGLCRELWEKTGREWTGEPAREDRSPNASTFWRDVTAWRLVTAATELPDRFDALVVDEAQDFETVWWTPLQGLLAGSDSPITLLLDPEQDLWERNTDFGERLPVFPIRSNRRSTRAIADFAAQIVRLKIRHPWGVPDGEWPQVSRWKSEEEQLSLVEGKVRWLLAEQKVDLSRIAVVGMHAWEKSFLHRAGNVWNIPVRPVDDEGGTQESGTLRYATPHRFKGLEADVVLLVDVDGNQPGCRPRNLYVAASRARLQLYVFAKQGVELPEAPDY